MFDETFQWSHFLDKPKVGSVYNISWSADGTQLAGAGATGHVFLANVIERKVSWTTYEATLASRRTVTVAEFTNNTEDRLDFRDRVVKVSRDTCPQNHAWSSSVIIQNPPRFPNS